MIRIDEIYNHTFWPYIKTHVPKTRLFFCDPPGNSDSASLCNFGDSLGDSNYIYCHDQEPVDLKLHQQLFDSVVKRNADLNYSTGSQHSAIITSELNSESVKSVCARYEWNHYYYFFHGWAALDWYRGYNHSFLIVPWQQRQIIKTFASPNRIIGGQRQHRTLMLYQLAKRNLLDNWISFSDVCPVENVSVIDVAKNYNHIYQDIEQVIHSVKLPRVLPNEQEPKMSSCWLDQFEIFSQSLIYHVSETVYFGKKLHLTEKTFKPIALGMPFVLSATAGSLDYLKQYGFKTFSGVWDEAYDCETDDFKRSEMLADLLANINSLSLAGKQQLFQQCWPIIEHNWNWFYHGGFEKVLWNEFTAMLTQLQVDFND